MKPFFSEDQSVNKEPHLHAPVQGEPVSQEPALHVNQVNTPTDVDHSVWDEPALPVATDVPVDAMTYTRWYQMQAAKVGINQSWAVVFLVAMLGGPFALVGAFYAGGGMGQILGAVILAPLVEEVLKSAVAAWVVEKKPYLFCHPIQIIFCVVVSALAFAMVENLMYIHLYVDDPTPGFIRWRWTVCTALHAGASFLASLGLVRVWMRSRSDWSKPNLALGAPMLVAAMLLHGSYNAFAVMLNVFEYDF